MLYNNTELRIKVTDFRTYLLPGAIGIIAFNDIGRVWVDHDNFKYLASWLWRRHLAWNREKDCVDSQPHFVQRKHPAAFNVWLPVLIMTLTFINRLRRAEQIKMLTMKILQNRLKTSLLLLLFAAAFTTVANAQTKQEKEAAKAAEVKKLVDDQRYVFIAQTVLPQSGRVRQVTPDFDFTVTKDTITSWLPYFGRAFSATLGTEGGIKFESKDFEYTKSRE